MGPGTPAGLFELGLALGTPLGKVAPGFKIGFWVAADAKSSFAAAMLPSAFKLPLASTLTPLTNAPKNEAAFTAVPFASA
jgi:hypothetical protein